MNTNEQHSPLRHGASSSQTTPAASRAAPNSTNTATYNSQNHQRRNANYDHDDMLEQARKHATSDGMRYIDFAKLEREFQSRYPSAPPLWDQKQKHSRHFLHLKELDHAITIGIRCFLSRFQLVTLHDVLTWTLSFESNWDNSIFAPFGGDYQNLEKCLGPFVTHHLVSKHFKPSQQTEKAGKVPKLSTNDIFEFLASHPCPRGSDPRIERQKQLNDFAIEHGYSCAADLCIYMHEEARIDVYLRLSHRAWLSFLDENTRRVVDDQVNASMHQDSKVTKIVEKLLQVQSTPISEREDVFRMCRRIGKIINMLWPTWGQVENIAPIWKLKLTTILYLLINQLPTDATQASETMMAPLLAIKLAEPSRIHLHDKLEGWMTQAPEEGTKLVDFLKLLEDQYFELADLGKAPYAVTLLRAVSSDPALKSSFQSLAKKILGSNDSGLVFDEVSADVVLDKIRELHDAQHSLPLVDILRTAESELLQMYQAKSFATISRERTFLEFCCKHRSGLSFIDEVGQISSNVATSVMLTDDQKQLIREFVLDLVRGWKRSHSRTRTESNILEKLRILDRVKFHFKSFLPNDSHNHVIETLIKDILESTSIDNDNAVFPISCASSLVLVHQTVSNQPHSNHSGQSDKRIVTAIQQAPHLIDLGEWLHWDAIFSRSKGPLRGFIASHPALACGVLELSFGVFIRVTEVACMDDLKTCFERRDGLGVASNLLGLAIQSRPVTIQFFDAFKTSLGELYTKYLDDPHTTSTIIEAVCAVPKILRCELAVPALVNPYLHLPSLSIYAAKHLMEACRTTQSRQIIREIGFELNIDAWKRDHESIFVENQHFQVAQKPRLAGSQFQNRTTAAVTPQSDSSHPHVPTGISEQTSSSVQIHDSSLSLVTISPLVEPASVPAGTFEPETLEICTKIQQFYGIGDASAVVANLQQSNQAAITKLAVELYSREIHFVLEVVQNFDDSQYDPAVVPELSIQLDSALTFASNQTGFAEADVWSVCAIGKSTKTNIKGYIGCKGIGFKSLFKVTSTPQVHSRKYHFQFNKNESMGYISPTPLPTPPNWNGGTAIVLPLSPEHTDVSMTVVSAQIHDISGYLLLFLRKIARISFVDRTRDHSICMERFQSLSNPSVVQIKMQTSDDGMEISSLESASVKEEWLISKCVFNPPCNRMELSISETELAVAFPLPLDTSFVPRQLDVFAFLPLKSYGFYFIVQGDWIVTSSREAIDSSQRWNKWLLSQLPSVFVDTVKKYVAMAPAPTTPTPTQASKNSKAHLYNDDDADDYDDDYDVNDDSDDNDGVNDIGTKQIDLRVAYFNALFRMIPMPGQAQDFFAEIPEHIIALLENVLFVPTLGSLTVPSKAVLLGSIPAHETRYIQITQDFLSELGFSFVDPAIEISPSVAKALNIRQIDETLLLEVLTLCATKWQGSVDAMKDDGDDIIKWLVWVLDTIQRTGKASKITAQLKNLAVFPLRNKTLASMSDGQILDLSERESDSTTTAMLSSFRTAHPEFSAYVLANRDAMALCRSIGLVGLNSLSFFQSSVVKVLQDPSASAKVLIEAFVVAKRMSSDSNIESVFHKVLKDSKSPVYLVDSECQSFKAHCAPLHFGSDYTDAATARSLRLIAKKSLLDWNFVSHKYLELDLESTATSHESSRTDSPQKRKNVQEASKSNWRRLLHMAGVRDFVCLNVTADDVDSPELMHILALLEKQPDSDDPNDDISTNASRAEEPLDNHEKEAEQRFKIAQEVLRVLNENWSEDYDVHALMKPKAAADTTTTTTTTTTTAATSPHPKFITRLREAEWVPCNSSQQRLFRPSELFVDTDAIRAILHERGKYPCQSLKNAFAEHLGIRTSISVLGVIDALVGLRGRKVALAEYDAMYFFLEKHMNSDDVSLLQDKAWIFVPDHLEFIANSKDRTTKREARLPGTLLTPADCIWKDESRVIDQYGFHRTITKDMWSLGKASKVRALGSYYPDKLERLFTRVGVPMYPSDYNYVSILSACSAEPAFTQHTIATVFRLLSNFAFLGSERHNDNDDDLGVVDQVKNTKLVMGGHKILPLLQKNLWGCLSSVYFFAPHQFELPAEVAQHCVISTFDLVGSQNSNETNRIVIKDLESNLTKFFELFGIQNLRDCKELVVRNPGTLVAVNSQQLMCIASACLQLLSKQSMKPEPRQAVKRLIQNTNWHCCQSIIPVERYFRRSQTTDTTTASTQKDVVYECDQAPVSELVIKSPTNHEISVFVTSKINKENFCMQICVALLNESDAMGYFIRLNKLLENENTCDVARMEALFGCSLDGEPLWLEYVEGAENDLIFSADSNTDAIQDTKTTGVSAATTSSATTADSESQATLYRQIDSLPRHVPTKPYVPAFSIAPVSMAIIQQQSTALNIEEAIPSTGKHSIETRSLGPQSHSHTPTYQDFEPHNLHGFVLAEPLGAYQVASHTTQINLTPTELEQLQRFAFGSAAEAVVAAILETTPGLTEVTWMNQQQESGLPYDITALDSSGVFRHIEVKSTAQPYRPGGQALFQISENELEFARSNDVVYDIYFVFDVRHSPLVFHVENVKDKLQYILRNFLFIKNS